MKQRGKATGHHGERRTPYGLVQRESVAEQIAAEGEQGAGHEETEGFLLYSGGLAHQFAAVETYQGMGGGGEGAEQTLGVDGGVVVEMGLAKHCGINAVGYVAGVGGVAVAIEQQQAVQG